MNYIPHVTNRNNELCHRRICCRYRYLYLVESVSEGMRMRQRTIRTLGRKEVLQASGQLDRLIASFARHSERSMVLSNM